MTTAPSATNPTDEPVITFVRDFDAPRERVFKAWTEPEQLKQWWGPEGFTVPRCEVDLRPGGAWRIDMQGPDGTIYPNKGIYLEVIVPEKLVTTDDVDVDETAWGDTPPPSSTNTMLFEEIDGKTRLTVVTRLQTIEQRDAMLEMGVEAGWNESLDKLARLFATA